MTIRCQTIAQLDRQPRTFDQQVALIIPAYNEVTQLEALLARCRAVQPAAIVVIDDASTDGTDALLARLSAEEYASGAAQLLHVLRNPRNLGKQGSVRRGLRYLEAKLRRDGLDQRGRRLDAVALIDGDGQHDPAELPALATLLETHHAVIGARAQTEMPLQRRVSNGLVNVGYLLLGGVDFVDVQSGLRLYRWAEARLLAAQLPARGRYGLEHESLALLARAAQRDGRDLSVAAALISCAYGPASKMRAQDMVALAFETVRQALRVRRAQRVRAAANDSWAEAA